MKLELVKIVPYLKRLFKIDKNIFKQGNLHREEKVDFMILMKRILGRVCMYNMILSKFCVCFVKRIIGRINITQ